MHELFLFLFASKYSAPVWAAISALVTLLVQKFFISPREKRTDKREDFKVITDSLLKDITLLRSDLNKTREEANACDKKYQELQDKFLDFKAKYSQLELRYQIQIEINSRLAQEIKELEEQLKTYLPEKNDRQTSINSETPGTTEE